MRVSIHTLGTRGDVQPYLALAREMRSRGHEVMLVAPAQFADMAAAEQIGFAPLPAEFLETLESSEAKSVIGGSGGGFGAGLKLIKHYVGMMSEIFDREWAAARDFGPDAILFHPKSLVSPHIAQKLGIPAILASPLPGFTPTSAFPTPILPFGNLGPLNRLSHGLMIHGGGVLFGKAIRKWRVDSLGLPPRGRINPPAAVLFGYSPSVLPKPADWGADVAVTGYWTLTAPAWSPDPGLARFLQAGEAPVYIGFGSMPEADPEGLTRRVIDGVRLAGKRGLLGIVGGALTEIPAGEDIHFIQSAPHDALFPLVASTIHHGGAGTTGASLRAGKPTTICPFLGDQPFWGRQVARLGVGPDALDKRRLSAEDIAAAITFMDDEAVKDRASALGRLIRAEDGTASAVDIVERTIATR
ncbi:MAG: glycosyltransferase family 1 protein [Devosia sp.]|uniref:glycosyltransferase n=1 Tax=Devosia sp. TaxID=1871048 RepID=UPI0024CA56CA|nr:glycosyltransferase [Devosia sp.]UYN99861.1 MAG: glycosyltransferase family 1 protein [Devosia sp.]